MFVVLREFTAVTGSISYNCSGYNISVSEESLIPGSNSKCNYLVVGAGPYGAIFAYEAAKRGKRSLVIEKRAGIGGNMCTHTDHGVTIHDFGAHIVHTDNKEIWDYIRKFADFNGYQNQVVANYKGHLYNLPFNMNTFYEMWGTKTPDEAKAKIEKQKKAALGSFHSRAPKNLEEQVISLIGTDIYEKLIKGYTEKQWGRKATESPALIIKRLPVRFIFDNNYFNHRYEGIPIGGYTQIFNKLLDNPLIDVQTGTDFFAHNDEYPAKFPKIIYTEMQSSITLMPRRRSHAKWNGNFLTDCLMMASQ